MCGSFFVLCKAVLRVGAQAIFPFKRLFKRKIGKLPGRLLGIITKDGSFSFVSFKAFLRDSYVSQPLLSFLRHIYRKIDTLANERLSSLVGVSTEDAKGCLGAPKT